MDEVDGYALVALSVLMVNLIPAFGPPTWSVLVLWFLHGGYRLAPLVLVGAAAAACGRMILARTTRRLSSHLPSSYRTNLRAARPVLQRNRGRSLVGLSLFAVSPLPSAQLFEAAGLLEVALVPLTLAFFAGRLASCTLYLQGAKAFRGTTAGNLLLSSLTSPWGALLEFGMLAGLFGLTRVDWVRHAPEPHHA
jgi:hypothetical protein